MHFCNSNLIYSFFPNSIPKSRTKEFTTSAVSVLLISFIWLLHSVILSVIYFKLRFIYNFGLLFKFEVWSVFIMWFKILTAAAVNVIYSNLNHSILYFPFITRFFRAYANNVCTNAYNFLLYRDLTVKISVICISSSLYHWNIRFWGGFCFVLPIFIQ